MYIVFYCCLGFCFVFGINLIWLILELVNILWRDGLLVVFYFSNICLKLCILKFFIIIVWENVLCLKLFVIEIIVIIGRFDFYIIVIMSCCWFLFLFIINRLNND